MLRLSTSTETYNNEQVSKVLDRISAKTCLKMDYFGSRLNPKYRQVLRDLPLDPLASSSWELRLQIPF